MKRKGVTVNKILWLIIVTFMIIFIIMIVTGIGKELFEEILWEMTGNE